MQMKYCQFSMLILLLKFGLFINKIHLLSVRDPGTWWSFASVHKIILFPWSAFVLVRLSGMFPGPWIPAIFIGLSVLLWSKIEYLESELLSDYRSLPMVQIRKTLKVQPVFKYNSKFTLILNPGKWNSAWQIVTLKSGIKWTSIITEWILINPPWFLFLVAQKL